MADAQTVDAKQWTARHKFARISPFKARLVVDLIRNRPAGEALTVLEFSKQRASGLISQVLKSAMANADEAEADVRRLFVSEARVDPGPYMRRWRPKDRGRAHPIAKRMSHIVVSVSER